MAGGSARIAVEMNKWQLRREAGQALILVALAMPLFMSIAALVVDGTNLMVHRRQLQTAADGAALAAAQDVSAYLPISPTVGPCATWGTQTTVQPRPAIVAAAEDYSSRNNGPGTLAGGSCALDRARCSAASDTNCYTWPYVNNSPVCNSNPDNPNANSCVEVRLEESVSGFFTNAVDALVPGNPVASAFNVSARSVGSGTIDTTITSSSSTSIRTGTTIPASATTVFTTTTGPGAALFAMETACGANNGISISGNNNVISGLAFSNGSITINGLGSTGVDNAIYGGPNTCPLDDPENRAATASTHPDTTDWPKVWNRNTVCDAATPGNNTPDPLALDNPADGVYCSGTSIDVTDLRSPSALTLVAPTITLPSSINNISVNAFFDGLLFWQTSGDFTFAPNNWKIDGWIWVPQGRLTLSGNNGARGFFEALDVTIGGNGLDLSGNGPIDVTQTVPVTTSTIPGLTDPGTTQVFTDQTTRTVGTTLKLDE
jgi:Putative Flp pilus-assembly TadE/G-like